MFFGVNFLFGSVFVWLAVASVGPIWAVLAAFLGALHTVELWGHWCAVLLFTFETAFVAVAVRKIGASRISLSILIFWVLLGIPLSLFLYSQALDLPWETSLLVAVKQTLNSLLNAMFASLLLTSAVLLRPTLKLSHKFRETNSYSNLLQAIFGLAFLSPILLSEFYELRQRFSQEIASASESLATDLERTSKIVASFLEIETVYWATKLNVSEDVSDRPQFPQWNAHDKPEAPSLILERLSDGDLHLVFGKPNTALQDFKETFDLSALKSGVLMGCYNSSFVTTFSREHSNPLIFFWPSSSIKLFISQQLVENVTVQCLAGSSGSLNDSADAIQVSVERAASEKTTTLRSWIGGTIIARVAMQTPRASTLQLISPLRQLVMEIQSDTLRAVQRLCILAMFIVLGGQLLDYLFRTWVEKFVGISETSLRERKPPVALINTNFREDREITKWLERFATAVETEEQEKLLAQRSLQMLIAKAAIPVFATDSCGNITEWNPAIADLTGFHEDEIKGGPLADLTYGSDSLSTNRKKGEFGDLFADLRCKSGRTIHLVVSQLLVGPVSDTYHQIDDTSPTATYYIAQNLSELKEAQAKLIHACRLAALGEMASSFAHELNQPLNTISLSAGNVLERAKTQTLPADYLVKKFTRIEEQALRAGRIIQSIRNFVLKTGESEITIFDPISRTQSAAVQIKEQLRLNNVHIKIDPPNEKVGVVGRPVLFEQTIINLLINAQQAMSENDTMNREIQIGFVIGRTTLTIDVMDTGPGVSQENIQRIFDPFFSTKKLEMGSGVGLYMSKTVIEAMNGHIQALDCSFGAHFEIQLPLTSRSGLAV